MQTAASASLFEERRAFLLGLAYRILGSHAEAEDAVQDTFLKWNQADQAAIDNPSAWLTTVCTRHCIDLLRAARQARVDYVGAWLPEPIQMSDAQTPEAEASLASSLSMAFLLLLERLSPKERAAYLLHEVFDRPYPEVALALGVGEVACRKLVSRARERIGGEPARHVVPRVRQLELLAAFRAAVESGSTQKLAALMSEDIRLSTDSGGKVPSLLETLVGRDAVLEFVGVRLHEYWKKYGWLPACINGSAGVVLSGEEGVAASVSFACDAEGNLAGIYITRNPDKLARLPTGLPGQGVDIR